MGTKQEEEEENIEPADIQLTPAEISMCDVDILFQKLASVGVTYVGLADLLEQYSLKSHKQPMVY